MYDSLIIQGNTWFKIFTFNVISFNINPNQLLEKNVQYLVILCFS